MGKLSEKQTARYIRQAISAMMYIHKFNIFHRDIKPENILICSGDQLKITDFGWATRAISTKRKTQCGTMDYICPEIVQHLPYDGSIDLWTLGVLTYELSTGSAPFKDANRKNQQYKILKGTV